MMTTANTDLRGVHAEFDAALGPFEEPEFRAGLATLTGSVQEASRRWAADVMVLAALASSMPRHPNDERGGTPWTSFLREVAVARRASDQAAASEVHLACALVESHPVTLGLLRSGRLPVLRARVLVEECSRWPAAVAAVVEAELAEQACLLPPWRIRQAVTAIALRVDADAAAAREAAATSCRTARKNALEHGQAEVVLTGPAVPLARWWDALTSQARALKAAGDRRSLGALRFDLATRTDPRGLTGLDPVPGCTERPEATGSAGSADSTDGAASPGVPAGPGAPDPDGAPAPSDRPTGPAEPGSALGLAPPLTADRRCVRPVQAHVTVPVGTALGLSDEPGWLEGHGWLSAPLCRQLLTVAELRKICLTPTGQVIDAAPAVVRPALTPEALRAALLDMVHQPFEPTDAASRTEPQHDPSAPLARLVTTRDRFCDGPTGAQVPATRCDLDHDQPYPAGPTAAWNLAARSGRTHQLKHAGWTPLRTPTSTLWFSPAGQIAEVPRFQHPPPEFDDDAELPDPTELHRIDVELCRPPTDEDRRPLGFPDDPPF